MARGEQLLVVCLCAAWCDTCGEFRAALTDQRAVVLDVQPDETDVAALGAEVADALGDADREHLNDEQYLGLQNHLIEHPDAGAVIRETAGVRKVRWRSGGKGKSGGVRVIYNWVTMDEQIFFRTIYGKSQKEDLTSQDLRDISKLLEELTNG